MEITLFSARSIWTMLHGIIVGGGALLALAAAIFYIYSVRVPAGTNADTTDRSRPFVWLSVAIAALLWVTVIAGTYIVFPPYRATPPDGLTDLSAYPRSLIQSKPGTVWLHAFGMEIKEHMPWMAAMLATAVAFVAARYRSAVFAEGLLRRATMTFLVICFLLASFAGLLGIFANKVAPLQ